MPAAGLLPRRGELRGWHLAASRLLRELATLVRKPSLCGPPCIWRLVSACHDVLQNDLRSSFQVHMGCRGATLECFAG